MAIPPGRHRAGRGFRAGNPRGTVYQAFAGGTALDSLAGLAAVTAVAVLVAGCTQSRPNAPLQVYPGATRPAAEVATVECGFSTRILAIDGNRDYRGRALRDRFSLLPGRHSFRVTLIASAVKEVAGPSGPRTVTFRLEPGHVYDISVLAQPVAGHRWGVVVVDRTAGADIRNPYIADDRPSPAPP